MLALTRKADYALVAMAELARRSPSSLSAREVAERARVPLPMLTNILHRLLRHGLIRSTMGSKGGYQLAKAPADISLAEMIDATEGGFKLTPCCPGELGFNDETCELEETCPVKDPVRYVHQSLRWFLSQVTLAQIAFHTVPIVLGMPAGEAREQSRSAGSVN